MLSWFFFSYNAQENLLHTLLLILNVDSSYDSLFFLKITQMHRIFRLLYTEPNAHRVFLTSNLQHNLIKYKEILFKYILPVLVTIYQTLLTFNILKFVPLSEKKKRRKPVACKKAMIIERGLREMV